MVGAHLVETCTYDREAAVRAGQAIPDFEELRERGGRLLPHFGELLDDLFAALFKLAVRLRPEGEVPASTMLNRRILGAVLRSPVLGELREETALSGGRSAHVACELARRVLTMVRSGDFLLDEELLVAQRLAEEAEGLRRTEVAAVALRGGPLDQELDRAVAEARLRVGDLAGQLKRSVGELPPRFDAELASTAARLGEDLPAFEESADDFARAVGAAGPRGVAERLRLAEKLEGSDKLRQLARLAGAFRAEARAVRRRRRERAADEVFRVGRGDDLARLLPSELSALRHPLRRADFLRRLLEEQLAQYDLRGDDRRGRGPLVVCLDGSGSMAGARELWAKAVTLALLEIARRQGRRARALVFAGRETEIAVFDLIGRGRAGRRAIDLEAVVGLAEAFPGGGTDFEGPLRAALEAVAASPLRGADVVFVTDGEAPVSDALAAEIAEAKRRRDCSIFAVIVDDPSRNRAADQAAVARAARELGKVADRLTTVTELTSRAAGELFRAL